jgi:TetR/AcrR family transcriptional regulator
VRAAAHKRSSSALPITRPKKRADRNPQRTRAQIVAAAEAEFASKGFEGARLANIAAAANVQQALIYHYFADKESLYEEVMRAGLDATSAKVWDLIEIMKAAVGPRDMGRRMHREDIEAIITAFVGLITEFYVNHGALVALLSYEVRKGNRAVRFIQERVRPMFESVVAELERMRARGDIRPSIDTKQFAISAVAIVAYPVEQKRLMQAVWPKGSALEDGRQATVIRLLCDALLP